MGIIHSFIHSTNTHLASDICQALYQVLGAAVGKIAKHCPPPPMSSWRLCFLGVEDDEEMKAQKSQ